MPGRDLSQDRQRMQALRKPPRGPGGGVKSSDRAAAQVRLERQRRAAKIAVAASKKTGRPVHNRVLDIAKGEDRYDEAWASLARKRTDHAKNIDTWRKNWAPPPTKGPVVKLIIGVILMIMAFTLPGPQFPWVICVIVGALLIGNGALGLFDRFVYYEPPIPPYPPRFTTDECHIFMDSQPEEEFSAVCTCWGCSEMTVHAIRAKVPLTEFLDGIDPHQPLTWFGDPDWADVIRHCDTCGMEWGQK